MKHDKKNAQLGMNFGTATYRLTKDLLFNLVKQIPCYRCGGPLERTNFSVEHITPWLDSEDPVGLFFDLNNITYSHLSCNVAHGRRTNKIYVDALERKRAQSKRWREVTPKEEQQARRRVHYIKTGN